MKRRFCPALLALLALLVCSGCGIQGYGANVGEPPKPAYHVVADGETFSSISQRYGVPSRRLMLINGFRTTSELTPGTRILVGYLKGSASSLTRSAKRGVTRAQAVPEQTVRLRQDNGGKRLLSWPLRVGRLVSRFGPRSGSFHDGLDLAAPTGTPIYAAHDGEIAYSGDQLGGYGKLLIIRGDDKLYTVYAHNSRLLVDGGDRVRRGQKIAEVGSTGHSTGPHLHFEVRLRDSRGRVVAVDPLPLLTPISGVRPRYRVNESLTPLLARLRN